MSDGARNRREYFRLWYPAGMMPSVRLGGLSYKVVEISEGGMRFRADKHHSYSLGDEVSGTITFRDGSQTRMNGVIQRIEGRQLIVAPLEGVTFRKLVHEQRAVRRAFPLLRF